jgi:hypothetical protein
MNAADGIADWLRALLGVERFDGHAAFLYDGRIPLSIDLVDGNEGNGTLLLQARVGSVPPAGREGFYAGLLGANHPSGGLRGCALALDAAQENAVLWYQHPASALDIGRFQDILTGFLTQADGLEQQITRGGIGDEQGADDERQAREERLRAEMFRA